MDLEELAKLVEAGGGLNIEIAKALGWRTVDRVGTVYDTWLAPWESEADTGQIMPPNLLGSIDAVDLLMRKLFPNAVLNLGIYLNHDAWRADRIHTNVCQCAIYMHGNHLPGVGGAAPTEARARLAALLRAVAAKASASSHTR